MMFECFDFFSVLFFYFKSITVIFFVQFYSHWWLSTSNIIDVDDHQWLERKLEEWWYSMWLKQELFIARKSGKKKRGFCARVYVLDCVCRRWVWDWCVCLVEVCLGLCVCVLELVFSSGVSIFRAREERGFSRYIHKERNVIFWLQWWCRWKLSEQWHQS